MVLHPGQGQGEGNNCLGNTFLDCRLCISHSLQQTRSFLSCRVRYVIIITRTFVTNCKNYTFNVDKLIHFRYIYIIINQIQSIFHNNSSLFFMMTSTSSIYFRPILCMSCMFDFILMLVYEWCFSTPSTTNSSCALIRPSSFHLATAGSLLGECPAGTDN